MRHAIALGLGLALVGRPAAANGRFPRAQQVIEDASDPSRLILRSTYGVLTSADAGQSWYWICEQAIGYGGTEDPALGLTENGTVLAGVFHGLSLSTDGGCGWTFAGGPLTERYVVDLTVERADPSRALALVSMGQSGGTFLNQLFRSTDDGATWVQLGGDLPVDLLGLTLDPAPSDPTRIYLSALEFGADGGSSQGQLLSSTDDGASFQRIDIPGTSLQDAPFIAAVDPDDPLRLYVRVAGGDEDYLVVSKDGGTSFEEVIRGRAELYGFALSPDGSTVLAGFGDPRDGTDVDQSMLGIWRASAADLQFSRIYAKPVACLTWTPHRLYACTGQFDAGFELGASSDGGQTFEALMKLADLQGPLECSAGTATGDACPAEWQATCETIGKCTAGTGGTSGGAGAAGSSGSAAGDGGDDGCGCRVPGGGGARALGAIVASLFLLLRRRRLR